MSKVIKGKKDTGIKTKRTTSKKPNQNNNEKDNKKSGGKRHPAMTIINSSDLA
jgi:hypothetical protein